jgi:hypothetical protein
VNHYILCILQDVDLILAIMAGILHLCNIDFVAEPEYGQVIIMNENEVDAGVYIVINIYLIYWRIILKLGHDFYSFYAHPSSLVVWGIKFY